MRIIKAESARLFKPVEGRRQESENDAQEDLEQFHTYLEERIPIPEGAQDGRYE